MLRQYAVMDPVDLRPNEKAACSSQVQADIAMNKRSICEVHDSNNNTYRPSAEEIDLVQLEQEDAARLIRSARPKALYLIEVAFDPEEAINDAAEALAQFGVDKLPTSLKAR